MIPKIKSVKPLENFILYVVFDDGKTVYYDYPGQSVASRSGGENETYPQPRPA